MRYDCFVIWGNGIQYKDEIVSMIRNHPDFELIYQYWYNINCDMLDFLKQMYACDDAPWEHLERKTQYLLNSPKKIFFILVRNYNPQISNKRWAKEQCETVVQLKNEIRSRFNPRFNNPKQCGPPLPPGVSHQHVIHASDYESQVDHELKVLGLKPLDWFKRYNDCEYFIPHHLKEEQYRIDKNHIVLNDRNIDDLRVSIIGKKKSVSIIETPYYKYLCGQKEKLIEYIKKYSGVCLTDDHSLDSFEQLDKNFKLDYLNRLGQKCYPIVFIDNQVIDGGHRLAIMKKRNMEKVTCIQIG